MVSLADVKRWNPGVLNEVANTIRQRVQVLIHSGDDFCKLVPVEGWSGPASQSAASAQHELLGRMEAMAEAASIVGKTLAQASDAIPAVQAAITSAEELARKYGYSVGENGQVTDAFTGAEPPDTHPEDRLRAQQQVADAITQALRTADDIDGDLYSVLFHASIMEFAIADGPTIAAAVAAGATDDPGLTLLEPPKDGTAPQNAGWWKSLSPAGRDILLQDHPDWLGNLDGIPGETRSAANMARVPRERAALEQQRTAAQAVVDQAVYDPSGETMRAALSQLDGIKAKLSSLDTIEATMAQGDRQLLTLDTTGERVKAAVAVGNIDTAKHVAVFTPGFTTTVDGDLKSYDTKMQQLQQHSQDIANIHGDRGQVATVTWIGYEAPQASEVLDPNRSVISDEQAKIGAGKLDGFLNGIGASHSMNNNAPLHLTALGHSYGSLTTGLALQHDTPVRDAVVFGSPGLDISQRSDLLVQNGHMHSMWSDQDSVPKLDIANHFGVSPYKDLGGGMGIDQLSTGDATSADGHHLSATHEHGQYLDNNSTSQYNMASVVAGRPDLRIGYIPAVDAPTPPPTPGQPIPAPPGRVPQPPPR